MEEQPTPPSDPMANSWQCEHIRLSIFPVPMPRLGDHVWWESVTGTEPEKTTSQPRKGETKAEGPFLDGRLILSTSPLRIDWLLTFDPETIGESVSWPSIGAFGEASSRFLEAISKWLKTAPPALRVAVGTTVSHQVSGGYPAAIDLLRPLVKRVQLDDAGHSDFVYQINRPRASKAAPGLTVNRLSRWSAITRQVARMAIVVGESVSAVPVEESNGASVTLDINTAQGNKDELAPGSQVSVVRELLDLAAEIVAQGDVT
jgi:hypothetical protein